MKKIENTTIVSKTYYKKPILTQIGKINKVTQKNRGGTNQDHPTQAHYS